MKDVRIAIDTLTHGPYGLGRHDGKVILVPGTAPGDIAQVRISEDRKRYAIGEVLSLLEPGQSRTTPPCPYVDRCGGCSWQHIHHDTQSSSKHRNVADALSRTAKLRLFEMLPTLRASSSFHYRRRIRLHVTGTRDIGYRRAHSHQVVPIEGCLIASQAINALLPSAQHWVRLLKTRLASIELVESHDDKVILVGRGAGEYHEADAYTCREFHGSRRDVAGIVLSGPDWRHHWGDREIRYSLAGGIRMGTDADAFSQVSAQGNQLLLRELLGWADLRVQDRVLELYSGAGNFTLPMAQRAGEVVAIEAHEGLVRNGKENSRRNGFNNIDWRCQKARAGVVSLIQSHAKFQNIVLNPPRSGAKEVVPDIVRLGAERIFYVSCDPATLARDLAQLSTQGYRLERVRPIDLFPQTYHVEVLAELRRARECSDTQTA